MATESVVRAYGLLLAALGFLDRHVALLAAVLLGTAALFFWARSKDAEGAARFGDRLRTLGPWARSLAAMALVVSLSVAVLHESARLVRSREAVESSASASRSDAPILPGVQQYAPSVAILQERTYLRTISLPTDILGRIGGEGVGALAPYLGETSTEGVRSLTDDFKRSGDQVVVTRTVVRRDEVPLAVDRADVDLRLTSRGVGRATSYVADFKATYTVRNPRTVPAEVRIAFPVPLSGGTMEGFRLSVGGRSVEEPDQREQYSWSGTLDAGAKVIAVTSYRATGAGTFEYLLGSDRRRTAAFKMRVDSDRPLRYARSGLFPNRRSVDRSEWSLRDVLTSRAVSLVIPRSDGMAYLADKSRAFLPLWCVVFALSALMLRRRVAPAATIAFSAGLGLGNALSGYMPPMTAAIVGAIVAGVLGASVIRGRGALVAPACAALSLVFYSGEHAGLIIALAVVAVASVVVLLRGSRSMD